MAKDRLVVVTEPHFGSRPYSIAWWLADEGDHGARVGEYEPLPDDPEKDADERLFRLAERVCAALAKEWGKDRLVRNETHAAWAFANKADARRALARIKAEWKILEDETPWPDWAVEALRAGWKAPRGWQPWRTR